MAIYLAGTAIVLVGIPLLLDREICTFYFSARYDLFAELVGILVVLAVIDQYARYKERTRWAPLRVYLANLFRARLVGLLPEFALQAHNYFGPLPDTVAHSYVPGSHKQTAEWFRDSELKNISDYHALEGNGNHRDAFVHMRDAISDCLGKVRPELPLATLQPQVFAPSQIRLLLEIVENLERYLEAIEGWSQILWGDDEYGETAEAAQSHLWRTLVCASSDIVKFVLDEDLPDEA